MIPGSFDYHSPSTVDEAIALLRGHGGAKLLAGGHSLIPAMRFRLASPEVLIDLNRVPGLRYIREEDGVLAIGAPLLDSLWPTLGASMGPQALAQWLEHQGNPKQIRSALKWLRGNAQQATWHAAGGHGRNACI